MDVDAANPLHVVSVAKEPALESRRPRTFDDNGVTPICVLRHEGKLYLYYVGWQLGVKVRYYLHRSGD